MNSEKIRSTPKWEVVHGVLTPGGDPCYICPVCHSKESEHVYGIEGGTPLNCCPTCKTKLSYH